MGRGRGAGASRQDFWRKSLLALATSGLLGFAGCDPESEASGSGGGGGTPTPRSLNQQNIQGAADLADAAAANVGSLSSDIGPETDYGDRGSTWAVDQIVKAETGVDFNTLSSDEMYNELRNGMGIPVDPNNPPPGAIIISPSQGDIAGHVGIVGYNGLVYSNSSSDATWAQNYTLAGWHDAFDGSGGTYAFVLSNPAGVADYSATALSPDASSSGGPTGGSGVLGSPAIVTSSTAKIDTDGDPTEQAYDATWQPQTTGGYNSAQTSFVVVTKAQVLNDGAGMGDWALVTNNATGQQTWARVGDIGPAGGSGEISEAAASAVGIYYTKSSATVGNPSVTVQIYPGTRRM